jgi:hypothetical protein
MGNPMSTNLIQIKAFLGKYYPELAHSVSQDKYSKASLGKFFEQRFIIQNNKTQMIVDPLLSGLVAIISGNEIYISKNLYDHPFIDITNSMENPDSNNNPKSLYTPDVFSTMAYLICQNHTMFNIVGEIEEPIYIKYKSDYETFYNSVAIFNVAEGIDVEIVEEFESYCALNAVTNFILQPDSRLNLSTFYNNHYSALSFCLRNVIVQDTAKYSHILFGKGSSNVLDESKIHANNKSSVELLGCINPGQREFHAIIGILPGSQDYSFFLDHRHVVSGRGKTTFTPVVVGHLPADAYTNVSSLVLDHYAEDFRAEKSAEFLSAITDRATLERTVGVERFYNNKSRFLQFH